MGAGLPVCSHNGLHQGQRELAVVCFHKVLQRVQDRPQQRVPERRPGLGQQQSQHPQRLQTPAELRAVPGNQGRREVLRDRRDDVGTDGRWCRPIVVLFRAVSSFGRGQLGGEQEVDERLVGSRSNKQA